MRIKKIKVLIFKTRQISSSAVISWIKVLDQNKNCYQFFLRIVCKKKMKVNLRVLLSILVFVAAKSGKFRGDESVIFFVLFYFGNRFEKGCVIGVAMGG